MHKLSQEEFKSEVFNFVETLEPRRKSLLTKHLIALALFVMALAIAAPLKASLTELLVKSSFDPDDASTISALVAYLFLPAAFLWQAIGFAKTYKNENKNIYEGGESLKEKIFSKIVGMISGFEFSDTQDINPAHLKQSYLFGNFTKFYSEDVIYGDYGGCQIRMGEVSIENDTSKNYEGFAGLVIVIDFSNPELILRQNFNGNTVVIIDEKKNQEKYQSRFSDFKRLEFNNDGLEEKFEIFTTNSGEAKSFIRPQLFQILERLHNLIKQSELQKKHVDDKLYGVFTNVADFAVNNNLALGIVKILLLPITLPFRLISLGATSKADISVNKLPDTNFDKKNIRIKNIDKDVELAMFEDKLIVKLPYDKDLFQPNPIYQKPIIVEDTEIIYHLIATAKHLADYTVEMRAV